VCRVDLSDIACLSVLSLFYSLVSPLCHSLVSLLRPHPKQLRLSYSTLLLPGMMTTQAPRCTGPQVDRVQFDNLIWDEDCKQSAGQTAVHNAAQAPSFNSQFDIGTQPTQSMQRYVSSAC